MDKDIGKAKVEGIYSSIQQAINEATPGTIIRLSPGLYEESLLIRYEHISSPTPSKYELIFLCRTPGLMLEPKERGGEVTLQQYTKHCIHVDLPQGEAVTINHIRMLLKGPNKDEDIHW